MLFLPASITGRFSQRLQKRHSTGTLPAPSVLHRHAPSRRQSRPAGMWLRPVYSPETGEYNGGSLLLIKLKARSGRTEPYRAPSRSVVVGASRYVICGALYHVNATMRKSAYLKSSISTSSIPRSMRTKSRIAFTREPIMVNLRSRVKLCSGRTSSRKL